MNTPILQNKNSNNNKVLVFALYTLTIIVFFTGIIIPVMLISESGEIANWKPKDFFVPIYIVIILISFAGMSYIIAEILKNPSNETVWLENTLTVFGVVFIIIGVIAFFVAVSNDSPIGGIKRFSIVVGLLLLLFHLQLGLLCLGLASIHDKFNTRDEANDITVDDSGKVVYCPSCGKQVEVEPGDKVCYHCGGQL